MEYSGRRSRRRGHGYQNHTAPVHVFTPQTSKPWSFLSGFYSLLIMTSLIALIYMMLEYHCNTCSTNCDLNNITKSIDNIAKNLTLIKDRYYDLETKISKFSQDFPRIEGQIDILEALANTIKSNQFSWKTIAQTSLPNINEILNSTIRHIDKQPINVNDKAFISQAIEITD